MHNIPPDRGTTGFNVPGTDVTRPHALQVNHHGPGQWHGRSYYHEAMEWVPPGWSRVLGTKPNSNKYKATTLNVIWLPECKIGDMTRNNKKSKHHYVPQGYLRGFYASDSMLWVYDRQRGTYRHSTAAGIAYAKDFYTVDTIDEKDSTEIEDMFSIVESVALPLLVKLANEVQITDVERADIANFFALQILRVPEMDKFLKESFEKMSKALLIEKMSQMARNKEVFDSVQRDLKATGADASFTQLDLSKILDGDDIAVEFDMPRSYVIKQGLGMTDDLAKGLNLLDWHVLRAPKGRAFISSDNPFITVGDGILGNNSRKIFPLNRQRALLIGHTKNVSLNYVNATDKAVRMANNDIALGSDRYIFSHSLDLLKSITERTSIGEFMSESRASVETMKIDNEGTLLMLRSDKMLKKKVIPGGQ